MSGNGGHEQMEGIQVHVENPEDDDLTLSVSPSSMILTGQIKKY